MSILDRYKKEQAKQKPTGILGRYIADTAPKEAARLTKQAKRNVNIFMPNLQTVGGGNTQSGVMPGAKAKPIVVLNPQPIEAGIGRPKPATLQQKINTVLNDPNLSRKDFSYLVKGDKKSLAEFDRQLDSKSRRIAETATLPKAVGATADIINEGMSQVGQQLGDIAAANAPLPLQTELAQKNVRNAAGVTPFFAPVAGQLGMAAQIKPMLTRGEGQGTDGKPGELGIVTMAKEAAGRIANPMRTIDRGEVISSIMDVMLIHGVVHKGLSAAKRLTTKNQVAKVTSRAIAQVEQGNVDAARQSIREGLAEVKDIEKMPEPAKDALYSDVEAKIDEAAGNNTPITKSPEEIAKEDFARKWNESYGNRPETELANTALREKLQQPAEPQPVLTIEEARKVAKMSDAELQDYNSKMAAKHKQPTPDNLANVSDKGDVVEPKYQPQSTPVDTPTAKQQSQAKVSRPKIPESLSHIDLQIKGVENLAKAKKLTRGQLSTLERKAFELGNLVDAQYSMLEVKYDALSKAAIGYDTMSKAHQRAINREMDALTKHEQVLEYFRNKIDESQSIRAIKADAESAAQSSVLDSVNKAQAQESSMLLPKTKTHPSVRLQTGVVKSGIRKGDTIYSKAGAKVYPLDGIAREIADTHGKSGFTGEEWAKDEIFRRIAEYGPVGKSKTDRLAALDNPDGTRRVYQFGEGGRDWITRAEADSLVASYGGRVKKTTTATPSQKEIAVPNAKAKFTKPYNATPSALNAKIIPKQGQKGIESGLFGDPQGTLIAGGSGNTLAETGGYAPPRNPSGKTPTSPIEMPELVELAKEINSGKTPVIKQRLRAAHGTALGVFKSDGASGGIELKADIFLGEEIAQRQGKFKDSSARKEAMNKMREELAAANNIPVEDVVIRYDKNILKGYRVDSALAPRVLAHEVGHLSDWLPDKTVKRGNILGHIASLNEWLRKTISQIPTKPDQYLSKADRAQLRKQAVSQAKSDMAGRGPIEKEELSAAVAEIYKELVDVAIHDRKLVTYDEIMAELQNLTHEWKPFEAVKGDAYTKYRYDPKELYADLVSVWFNDAELARGIAPKTSAMLMDYMGRKPEVKAAYDAIQDRYTDRDAVIKRRLDGIYEMQGEGDAARVKAANTQPKEKSIRDWILNGLYDNNWPALKGIAERKKIGGDIEETAHRAETELEELNHQSAEVNEYTYQVDSRISKQMVKDGITPADLGAYTFLKRIQADRSQIANPRGHTAQSAPETMAGLKTRLGDAKFAAVEKAATEYRKMREELIFPVVEESGIRTPEQMQMMKESKDYGKFSVTKFMEDKYGKEVTAAIYHQYGTLQDIANPFLETVLQDFSLLVAAKRNVVRKALVSDLFNAGDIAPAEMTWSKDINGRIPKEPKNREQGLLTIMEDGKPKNYYVDKEIANLFKNDPITAHRAARVWGTVNGVLRDVLVSKNPAWQARNIGRDISGTIKNLNQIKNPKDVYRLASLYKSALKESWDEVFKGERSQDISQGYKERALPDVRMYSTKDANFSNLVEQRVNEFIKHLSGNDERLSPGWKQLKAIYNTLDKTGRVTELSSKLAGYKYLKQYAPEVSATERAHLTRTRVGTPDSLRRGAWNSVTNNIFMFSNINKEGMRSGLEAFKENPTRYAWKVAAFNIAPKLAIAGIGIWGAKTLLGKSVNKMDEYDKRMYTVVPLGLINNGLDSVYLRLPMDYEGTAISAAFWDAVNGRGAEFMRDIANMNPYKLNPILDTAYKGFLLYGEGVNPVDEYRQKNVISDQGMEAGGKQMAKEFSAYAWNALGGSTIYRAKVGAQIHTDETKLQEALRLPFLNAAGSFIRISHNGETSKIYEVIDKTRKTAAQKEIARKNATIDAINNGKNLDETYKSLVGSKLLNPNKTSKNEFGRTYNRYSNKTEPDQWFVAISNANGLDERKALFDAMPKEKRETFRKEYDIKTGAKLRKPTRKFSWLQ